MASQSVALVRCSASNFTDSADKREDLLSRQALLHADVPLSIDAMEADAILCDIDAECCNLCHDGLSCCSGWLSLIQPS